MFTHARPEHTDNTKLEKLAALTCFDDIGRYCQKELDASLFRKTS